ncbi:hypothetical protein RHMOL_Rhmol04G0096600 [Rhododendron molle]|uniref:Uncharacterized protein n=1 Tax=Rhododendron molle TaxID=49168 RepID=A0ACC0P161_RHOML|nr:hypothetical protein RHMOL_Rhmol04G0096600 [Rhododendron molle]
MSCSGFGDEDHPQRWRSRGGGDIRKIWLYNLFSKFGKVIDSYIPIKRSKISGNRFGFVRYAYKKEAMLALEKTDGLWIWNHSLVVNTARFVTKQANFRKITPQIATNIGHMQKQYTISTGFKQGQSSRSVEIKKGFSEFAGFKQKQSSRSIGLKKNQFPKSTGQRKKVIQGYRPKIQLKQVTGPDLNKPPIKLQAVGN